MSRILIVDDEEAYRKNLELFFSSKGHQVKTAPSGRAGIRLGARFRPDVLIVDWMLKDDIHGLHVSEVLGMVCPEMQTVLITGFPSDDLRAESQKHYTYAFLEKPFGLEEIEEVVAKALVATHMRASRPPMGVVEVDEHGTFVYANPRAWELFSATEGGQHATSLTDLFDAAPLPNLDVAVDDWIVAKPRSVGASYWRIRSEEADAEGHRLMVLLAGDDPHYIYSLLIQMLLGVEDVEQPRHKWKGHILIVDPDPLFRRLALSVLETQQCPCYAAETVSEGLKLLESNEKMTCVILDYDLPGTSIGTVLEQIRARRPGVSVIGNSGGDRQKEFAAIGVDSFLLKPWGIHNLRALLDKAGI